MSNTTLPRSLEIGGITHVEHFRGQNYVILQSYQRWPHQMDLVPLTEVATPASTFKLYAITHTPAETLGSLLFTSTTLTGCMNEAARLNLT
jgi:hypothetical protein